VEAHPQCHFAACRAAALDRLLTGLEVVRFNMDKMDAVMTMNASEAVRYQEAVQQLGTSRSFFVPILLRSFLSFGVGFLRAVLS
jgi:hypothetical protein